MSLITYKKHGSIADLRLNRADKLNAINAEMLDRLADALDAAAADDSIRALVLSGQGRAFSAGFDLDMGTPGDGESQREFMR